MLFTKYKTCLRHVYTFSHFNIVKFKNSIFMKTTYRLLNFHASRYLNNTLVLSCVFNVFVDFVCYAGLLCMECKHLHKSGVRVYLLDNYKWIDFTILSFYLSSYVLRFLVDQWIKNADIYYNGTAIAQAALRVKNKTLFDYIHDHIFDDTVQPVHSYFMKACEYIDDAFMFYYYYLLCTIQQNNKI